MRNDLARPASHFRTYQEGRLPVGKCGLCGKDTYAVPEGGWFHWATLGQGCPVEVPETPQETPQETKTEVIDLDTAERRNARQELSSTYRRPSWEWMGCRKDGRVMVALSDQEHADAVTAYREALVRPS